MLLHLLRHARAVDREGFPGEDAQRPLTPEGRDRLLAVLKRIGRRLKADEVLCSPALRCRQTAELTALELDLPLVELPELALESCSSQRLCEALARRRALSPIVVGHEPDLGRLVGFLSGGAAVLLKKSGLAVLEGEPRAGGMCLQALLQPGWLL
jgi:phosphohistidine phosphatase